MTDVPDDLLWQRFHELVNMTSRELRDWLASPARDFARAVDGEPLPPLSAEVLQILDKRRVDVTKHDQNVMLRVIEVIESEYADGSDSDEMEQPEQAGERRRYRLLNVGHDPLRSGQ